MAFCCPGALSASDNAAPLPSGRDADALLIVDCALPAQVRQLGTAITYLAPRRATKTSASDCAIRGGEYVAYDRANLATALKVWLPQAQAGDQAAQTNVGEIYEKGLGAGPDYASAAKWYQLAADQGYSRALTNLGFLYERGLGVPKDPVAALKLYRKATGIAGTISLDGDTLQVPREEFDALRKELERTRQELEDSRRRLDEYRLKSNKETARLLMQKQQAAAAGNANERRRLEAQLTAHETELARQKENVMRLEDEVGKYKARLARLEAAPEPRQQNPAAVAIASPTIQIIDPQIVVTRDTVTVKVRAGSRQREIVGRVNAPAGLKSLTMNNVTQTVDSNGIFKTNVNLGAGKTKVAMLAVDRQGKVSQLQFFFEEDARSSAPTAVTPLRVPGFNTGNYYALVIGNQRYTKLPPLETPEADVTDLAPILRNNYGFKVTLLLNATRYQILTELNNLRAKLTEKDNLLIYYAGHGDLDRVNGLANWLPIDAEPASNANWISSSSLTELLNAMAAKHILVVADSCYSGALTRSSISQLETGLTDEARLNWLKQIATGRSRTALTSGGLAPVMDGGGGKYSIFASVFMDILSQNQDVLEGMRLYREVSARVVNIALRQKFEQRPEYGAIRFAGGEAGDFLFVPKN
jgi:hypothetical protein